MRDRKPFLRAGALSTALGIVLVFVLWMALIGPVSAVEAQTSQTPLANPTFWTSGWVTLAPGTSQVFNHNLGLQPEKYAVELWFQDADNGWGINRRNYGGLEAGGKLYGAHWSNLTANTVQVYRQADDNAADQIRIQVWVPPLVPDFDSGWIAIPASQQHIFVHGLGASLGTTPEELTVGLWFSGTVQGINHLTYGGLDTSTGKHLGAYWHNLTANDVRVTRLPDDLQAEQVRVFILRSEPPAYDSLVSLGGWQDVAMGSVFTFTHNLNWPPEMLIVRAECKDFVGEGLGIHQQYAGGSHNAADQFLGAHIQNLTDNTIQFVRRQNDVTCDQARVVIVKRSINVFLPLVLGG